MRYKADLCLEFLPSPSRDGHGGRRAESESDAWAIVPLFGLKKGELVEREKEALERSDDLQVRLMGFEVTRAFERLAVDYRDVDYLISRSYRFVTGYGLRQLARHSRMSFYITYQQDFVSWTPVYEPENHLEW